MPDSDDIETKKFVKEETPKEPEPKDDEMLAVKEVFKRFADWLLHHKKP